MPAEDAFWGRLADRIEGDVDLAAGFREGWRSTASPMQLPPDGEWRTAYWQGGRGSGKTYAGSHILAEWILADPVPGEWGIVAPTYQDAWSTCVEGPSGFLAALGTTVTEVRDGKSKLVEHWHRSFAELKLRNGHLVRVASAQAPFRFLPWMRRPPSWAEATRTRCPLRSFSSAKDRCQCSTSLDLPSLTSVTVVPNAARKPEGPSTHVDQASW